MSRVLARRGAPRLAALDPLTGQLIRASKATAIRYERARPGELVHMDVKKLARIPDGGGWRALGRAARETTRDRPLSVVLFPKPLPWVQGARCLGSPSKPPRPQELGTKRLVTATQSR